MEGLEKGEKIMKKIIAIACAALMVFGLVACGTPEEVAAVEASHTGRFLKEKLQIP